MLAHLRHVETKSHESNLVLAFRIEQTIAHVGRLRLGCNSLRLGGILPVAESAVGVRGSGREQIGLLMRANGPLDVRYSAPFWLFQDERATRTIDVGNALDVRAARILN